MHKGTHLHHVVLSAELICSISLAMTLAMKADILSVTLSMGLHKCCHANLVRPSLRLAERDGCFLRWFSIAVVGAMEWLLPRGSRWTTGCSYTLLELAHCGLLCGFDNDIITSRGWVETTLCRSLDSVWPPKVHWKVEFSMFQHDCDTTGL